MWIQPINVNISRFGSFGISHCAPFHCASTDLRWQCNCYAWVWMKQLQRVVYNNLHPWIRSIEQTVPIAWQRFPKHTLDKLVFTCNRCQIVSAGKVKHGTRLCSYWNWGTDLLHGQLISSVNWYTNHKCSILFTKWEEKVAGQILKLFHQIGIA